MLLLSARRVPEASQASSIFGSAQPIENDETQHDTARIREDERRRENKAGTARQGEARRGKTRQDTARQEKTRTDKNRQEKTRKDKKRQEKTRQEQIRRDCKMQGARSQNDTRKHKTRVGVRVRVRVKELGVGGWG